MVSSAVASKGINIVAVPQFHLTIIEFCSSSILIGFAGTMRPAEGPAEGPLRVKAVAVRISTIETPPPV